MSTRIAFQVTGAGPVRVLLLHALTGGPDPRSWWPALFQEGGALAGTTVWSPNLPGSCYGSDGPDTCAAFPSLGTREQAVALSEWIAAEGLGFDLLLGASLGGMVALELALEAPDRFGALAVIGCGGRADAWLWGTNEVQRAILRQSDLPEAEAIALARRVAMLSFRTPASLRARFGEAEAIRGWLDHHGRALAARFTRASYRTLLDAMDSHDLGRGRGGLHRALEGLQVPLHLLGMDPDLLFPRPVLEELAEAARAAGRLGSVDFLHSPHGHDAFLIETAQVDAWVRARVQEVQPCVC